MGCCLSKTDCTLSTDTGLAVGTAEHFYTCYHEAIYVSVEEANGYTIIFGMWADYNFPYLGMKLPTLEKSTDQKPDSSF